MARTMARTTDTAADALAARVRELLLVVRAFVERRESGHHFAKVAGAIVETESALLRYENARAQAAEGRFHRKQAGLCVCNGCPHCSARVDGHPDGGPCARPRAETWPLCAECLKASSTD